MTNLSQQKIFLVASSNPDARSYYCDKIKEHVESTTIYVSQDGSEALIKANNAPPHVIVISETLSKTPTQRVVEEILSNKLFSQTAILIVGKHPEQEQFVDAVVMGRVSWIDVLSELSWSQCLARGLTYASRGETSDFHLRFLAPGDTLLKEGDGAQFVYIVKKGELAAYSETNGTNRMLGTITVGEFVGEMAYINNEPRSATVIANSDCELIEIPIQQLDLILFQKPVWARALMRTLSKRVKQGNKYKGPHLPT